MNGDGRQLDWSTLSWGDANAPLPALDEPLMSLLLEHVSIRIAVIDRTWRYCWANEEALRFMGLPRERVVGHHMSEVLDRGVYLGFVPIFERLFTGESLEARGWVEYERQGWRYREQALIPYRPGGGDVEAVVVCGLDHTELRRSEAEIAQKAEAVRTSEALKAAIFDHALAALVSTDADGRIVEFNPSAVAMFGRARAEVLGRAIADVVIPERLREPDRAGMERLAPGGVAQLIGRRVELTGLRADGREFPIEMVLWRTDTNGKVVYTASIGDLSERHDAARQIERQREALRQGEKLSAMGSLLAGVAHELNNPLAIVMGRATLLEEKCELRPELKQDARRIYEAAERCGRIVRTFLNMARSRPGEKTSLSLNDVVRSTADMLAYAYRSHGIELRYALDPELPALNADGDQLAQVVLNLLVNAQQALALVDGPRRVQVSSGVDADTAQAWLRVADNGPGVSAEVRGRMFEPFYTTKPEGIGTGLGLSVSRSVAQQHGGDLLLEDASAGGGASFCLRLPLPMTAAPPTSTPAASMSRTTQPPGDAAALGHVLVVDDEAELGDLMRAMLEHAGYDVAVAESGAVALELLETARFDAIVSDLRMPDMDGGALWDAIAQRFPALASRVLFITGDTLSEPSRLVLQRTGCAALDKPFTKAALVAAVAKLT